MGVMEVRGEGCLDDGAPLTNAGIRLGSIVAVVILPGASKRHMAHADTIDLVESIRERAPGNRLERRRLLPFPPNAQVWFGVDPDDAEEDLAPAVLADQVPVQVGRRFSTKLAMPS